MWLHMKILKAIPTTQGITRPVTNTDLLIIRPGLCIRQYRSRAISCRHRKLATRHTCITLREWQLTILAVRNSGVKDKAVAATEAVKSLTAKLTVKTLSQVFNRLRRQNRTKTRVLPISPATTKNAIKGRMVVFSPFHPGSHLAVVFIAKIIDDKYLKSGVHFCDVLLRYVWTKSLATQSHREASGDFNHPKTSLCPPYPRVCRFHHRLVQEPTWGPGNVWEYKVLWLILNL